MVVIQNNYIIVSKDDPSYFSLHTNLLFSFTSNNRVYKTNKNGKTYTREYKSNHTERLYIEYNNHIYIPRGLYYYIKSYFTNSYIVDKQTNEISNFVSIDDFGSKNYENILEGITLRDYQIIALRKMLLLKRCIIQSPTGSGKTEIMSAFFKVIISEYGYPSAIVLEPTIKLVESTINRFKKYRIQCYSYHEVRHSDLRNKIIICHPTSLCNDIDNNPDILRDTQILIGDECHHMKSVTFRTPSESMKNLQYSIGLSATAICSDHIQGKTISDFNIDELNIIGSTGQLAMNMKPELLIRKGALATPVVFRMYNQANEYIPEERLGSWHDKVKYRLHSDIRNELICSCSQFFINYNRKVLILVNTIEWSRLLLQIFNDMNLSESVRASYGGNRFEGYNGEYFNDDNSMNKFASGDIGILIGTTHLYEGVDVPNLDIVVLGYAGKKDKSHLQGIGRSLRKSKNGKYAYIIDFTDTEDNVLHRQSNIRFKRYKTELGIPDNHIFDNVLYSNIKSIFLNLEELSE